MSTKLYGVEDLSEALSISTWQTYALLRKGTIRSVKIGKRVLVSEAALADYIASLEAHAADVGPPSDQEAIA